MGLRVWSHTRPGPLKRHTKPSPEKKRDFIPPALVTLKVADSSKATMWPVSTMYSSPAPSSTMWMAP